MTGVKNSPNMVCYLMILMNYHCAKALAAKNTGIFRTTTATTNPSNRKILPDSGIPEEVANFVEIWTSVTGQYVHVQPDLSHTVLDLDAYVHITSPIRRLVDLLNMIQFQRTHEMIGLSEKAGEFYEKWLKELEYINRSMRAIRKVQCDCSLLDLCVNRPETLTKEYDGYLFDKITRDGDGLYQYMVYIPEIKLSSRVTTRENGENFSCRKFRLILFQDEERFKKKIRLHMV
jgi:hypothetical protein